MKLGNQLSVRAPDSPIGGPIEDEVRPTGDKIDGQSHALLFVHGYNNSYDEALNSFETFSGNVFGPSASGQATLPLFGFFWPGDTHIKIISTLSYPAKIGPAKKSAERLFNYLKSKTGPNGGPLELTLVAHSVGCRVVLELIKRLIGERGRTAVTIGKVVLMAAAVPVSMVENSSKLGAAAAAGSTSLVLCSESDMVLFMAFPIGETLAFDAFWPTAVGRHGQPDGLWKSRQPMAKTSGGGYGHSDYWKGTESARAAASVLGVPVSPLLQTNATQVHELAPEHSTPVFSLSNRSLIAAPAFG